MARWTTIGRMTEQPAALLSITTPQAVKLYALKLRWDGRYHVSLTRGVWRAIRDTDELVVLTTATGDELAEKIEADYADWTAGR